MATGDNPAISRLWEEIDRREDELVELVQNLVRFPSVLGNEADIQHYIADHFKASGLDTEVWELDESMKDLPNAGDSGVPFAGRPNVAGIRKGSGGGQSLIMNGHVDVVSPEPVDAWSYDPWKAEIAGDRMYGRGALDMKSGVAINMMLPRLIRDAGIQTKGDLILHSVIEEECTGNGALAASKRHSADAAVVTEPSRGTLTIAHVGVMWFKIRVQGRSAHAAVAPTGVNAISKTVPIIEALEQLDTELNTSIHPLFKEFDHPINLNIGIMQSGDWPSTVPGAAELHCRVSFFPGTTVDDMKQEIEQAVKHACQQDPWLQENIPEVSYYGFRSEGSEISMDTPPFDLLGEWHKRVQGTDMRPNIGTGINDMRYYNFLEVPAGCYGASGSGAHAADEWLDVTSLAPTAKVLGAFLLDWCGVAES